MEIILGNPDPLGFSIRDITANFALFSSHAQKVTLALFDKGHPIKEFSMNRTKDIWHLGIVNLPQGLEYAYRCEGPKENLYKPDAWLIDPYAKIVRHQRAAATMPPPFDWKGDSHPKIAKENLIIYEMHVRGFTKHASSKVSKPGTYLGIIEKIPYLKKLGVNAIELMPIFGFDQNYCKYVNPKTGKKFVNYWGYNPLHYFFPMSWYADADPILEFKTLVRELHKNSIEVILDVVYNHTGEENDLDYYVHFRGIDNRVYYLLTPEGKYLNFTGCWNTVNTNHPAVQKFILDSLRYWVQEMHVDGFRFDLASILTRGLSGNPVAHSPILEAIAKDSILSKVKLIAEAWDAAGLYQVGSFPNWGPWSEWNGKYRDTVRRFLKGMDNQAGFFANVLCGSAAIYKKPLDSVNFITAHDGFCLKDLVSYEKKHNHENGENNQDGNNVNDSWNCGHEGPIDNPKINALRERQMRNFLLALFISQGIPMLLMGDEVGHTQRGNNNPYVQDNDISWFLWDQIDERIFSFVSDLIAFRLQHSQFRHKEFLKDSEVNWFTNWDPKSRLVAFQLQNSFYIAFNASDQPAKIDFPEGKWRAVVNTADEWKFQKEGPSLTSIELLPFSALLAIQGV